MVALLGRNYDTNYCEFTYDDWSADGQYLPKIGESGSGLLSSVKGCSAGSIAIGTDGSLKILNGDSNEWIDY